jgi:hypothetical protein
MDLTAHPLFHRSLQAAGLDVDENQADRTDDPQETQRSRQLVFQHFPHPPSS